MIVLLQELHRLMIKFCETQMGEWITTGLLDSVLICQSLEASNWRGLAHFEHFEVGFVPKSRGGSSFPGMPRTI